MDQTESVASRPTEKSGWLLFLYGFAAGLQIAFFVTALLLLGEPGFFTTISTMICLPLSVWFARQHIQSNVDRSDEAERSDSA